MIKFRVVSKMNECNSVEINITNLSEQTKFRLSEITRIENYFHREIKQRRACSKKLRKYITAFDDIDKILIVLNATTGRVSIISFRSVVGRPVGIASTSFTLIFSFTIGIIKKLITTTGNKRKKYDKILLLAKSKVISIETLVSQALIDMEISHEEFVTILNERDMYKKMKEYLKNVS